MKKLLIVVDFQNDFVSGSLGFTGAELLEDKIASLINEYKANNDDIIFTKDIHSSNYLNTEEGKNLPIFHCLDNSQGAELFGKIKDLSNGYPCFGKGAFGCLDIVELLKKNNYDEVSLCGIDTSICVLSNAVIVKSALPNAHVRLLAYASGCGDREAEEVAYKALSRIHVEIVK